jgi:hypothetical protein
MAAETTPLLFPEVLKASRLDQLINNHGLTQADLEWLQHVALPSHTLREAQIPPMLAETILCGVEGHPPIPLAGCFTLSTWPNPDSSAIRPAFLYTPYGGIKKFSNLETLKSAIEQMLKNSADRDGLFRFLSISQRNKLNAATRLGTARLTIDGDVFTTQLESIQGAQKLNEQAMVHELTKLPSLASMFDRVLKEVLPDIDHRQVRVTLGAVGALEDPKASQMTRNMSLSHAVLFYFHHQGWPSGHTVDFFHHEIDHTPENARTWETAVRVVARELIPQLTDEINAYWNSLGPGHISRRRFLSQVIHAALCANILLMREKKTLSVAQSQELLRLFRPSRPEERLLFIETVRLWEYEPHYVELAGSLMVSCDGHYLYTPGHGFQTVVNHQGFEEALLNTFASAERKEELYSLLSLEERNRYLRFDKPRVSGKEIAPPVSEFLAEAIIDKQLNNLHYALEMSRQSDVDVNALLDKALDIRSFINPALLTQRTDGRWGTRPSFNGNLRPSNLMADNAQRKIQTYASVEQATNELFTQLPVSDSPSLRTALGPMAEKLANAFSLGIRAEAELRDLNGTLPLAARNLIEAVFAYDANNPGRDQRTVVRGFRPDVYSLKLACVGANETVVVSLANCFLLTERGGLDTPCSGMAIFWTPADGLKVFSSVKLATEQLNRGLLDSRERFGLLQNLTTARCIPHRRYQIEAFELIEDNVLINRMESFVKHLVAEHDYLSTLGIGNWRLTGPALTKSLEALLNKGAPTNLTRATHIARSIRWQQKLPAWLGTASLDDQRLHIELLEQYKNSVDDDQDYLDGIEPLHAYVRKQLKGLLDARFGKNDLDPDTIQITPKLALLGPVGALTDFALRHINLTQGTGFQVTSMSTQQLPPGLNEATIKQMLLSLSIPTTYATRVLSELDGSSANVQQRKQRFCRQLPWQLLQYAHALHLQQHLCASAFDMIRQVLDMPDAVARQAVEGASAFMRPLELIKTGGAAAVQALGLYLIGSSNKASSHVLYAPYHEGHSFIEFKDEASIVAAFNKPGTLQDLLIHRLPQPQQATFRNLFAETIGKLSEITLASNPIQTNVLETLFNDNTKLLPAMLATQADKERQFDWETVTHLFSSGVKTLGRMLSGKLAFIETLWDSYQDFYASSEAFQQRRWKDGLHDFIAGAAEMVSLGLINRDDTFGLLDPAAPVSHDAATVVLPKWNEISSTAPARTDLQAFEAIEVSLKDLHRNIADGTYKAVASGKLYAPVAGKVFQTAKAHDLWRIIHADGEGPLLKNLPDSRKWAIDPQLQNIRYGKAMSTLSNSYSDYKAAKSLNIEARGMTQIRRTYPHHGYMIVQALATARGYCANTLHNLNLVRRDVIPGSRMDQFLKAFLGVNTVDSSHVQKILAAVSPVCQALADPSWELHNGERIVVGALKDVHEEMSAFVFGARKTGRIYLTQHFFAMNLGWYTTVVPMSFNVDAHAQAATFIHEISHQLFDTLDIAYLDVARPFPDLISTVTHYARKEHDRQLALQRDGFSLTTPRTRLFMKLDPATNMLKSLELFPEFDEQTREILKITGTRTMDQARDAFLDPVRADKRIDLLLRNADSMTLLICELGRQIDPGPIAVP